MHCFAHETAAAGFLHMVHHLEKWEQDLKRRLQHGLMLFYRGDYYKTHRLQLLHWEKNTLCCFRNSQSKLFSTTCKWTLKCPNVITWCCYDTAPSYSHDEEETSILQRIPLINICWLGGSDIFEWKHIPIGKRRVKADQGPGGSFK